MLGKSNSITCRVIRSAIMTHLKFSYDIVAYTTCMAGR